jgi:PRTRC genetic system ParB family protein
MNTAENLTENSNGNLSGIMSQLSDKALLHAPINSIEVRDDFNPRRFFAPEKMQELSDSIRSQGVIQPIVVKPKPENDGFYLIAGERRFRAAMKAELKHIPVMVRLVSDDEALSMAIAENTERDDMSVGEEAKACQRLMLLHKGDIEEVAHSLSWSLSKVKARLSLLYCSDNVLTALEERNIKAGHAELLSTLSKDMQDQSLPGILENNVSVADLKKSIGRYAYQLSSAAFDVSGCADCVHNSSSTSDMFDTRLDGGQCLNRDCFDGKTLGFINEKKISLEEKYPVIWLDIEKPKETRCFLVRDGKYGVGKDQYTACMGCASFGALLMTDKGNEGHIEEDICFDIGCNKKKVLAHQKELNDTKTGSDTKSGGATNGKSGRSPQVTTTKKKKTVAETPKKVIEYVNKRIHAAAGKEVFKNQKLIRVMSITALFDAHKASKKDSMIAPIFKKHNLEKEFFNSACNHPQMVKALYELEDSALGELICILTAAIVAENQSDSQYSLGSLATAKMALKLVEADISEHFIIDQEYLETLTVTGLLDLMTESGFLKWYDSQKGKKKGDANKEILKGKRADQIKSIIDAGFNWKGFVPKTVNI